MADQIPVELIVEAIAKGFDKIESNVRGTGNAAEQMGRQAKQTNTAVGDLDGGMTKLEKTVAGTRTTIGRLDDDLHAFGRNLGSTADLLSGLGVNLPINPMQLFGQAVKGAADFTKAAIGETVAYAKEVRDLGRTIGASAEESSKLIQAADDVLVSYNSLTSALEAAVRKGVKPTIEGLGELADEYNDIQDPITRTKFLMDNFGRSGADLAPLMELGAEGVRELGDAAKAAGLVMTEEAIEAAREYEKALDKVEERVLMVKLAIGNALVPALVDASNEVDRHAAAWDLLWNTQGRFVIINGQLVAVQARELSGLADINVELDTYQQFLEDTGVATVGVTQKTEDWGDVFTQLKEKAEKASKEITRAMKDLAIVVGGAVDVEMDNFAESQDELEEKIAATRAELEKYQAMHGQVRMVTTDTAEANRNLIIAQAGAETAARNLAEAQADLAKNIDPDKQLQLQAAVARAEGALITASGKVDEWNGKLAESGNTFVTDYSTKIGEFEGDLGELESAYGANADAHEAAVKRMLFNMAMQRAYEDGEYSTAEKTFLSELASAWQIKGADTELAIFGIDNALKALADGGSKDAFIAIGDLLTQLGILPPSGTSWDWFFNIQTSGAFPTAGPNPNSPIPDDTAPSDPNAPASPSRSAPGSPAPGPVNPGDPTPLARGADFIVPPGYPNDSFHMRVQSGEHVTVVPAGQAGNRGGPMVSLTIGAITIVTAATDARGISQDLARELRDELAAQGLLAALSNG
ncbi:MAG: hypothetical protein IT318_23825 [Anaerolineales bacterium]|nr:hypothetical protein [Anaerolineales bacterium]